MSHFVIVGGVSAGTSAAARARRLAPKARITILEKSKDVSYRACGIPEALAAPDSALDDLIVRPAAAFAKEQILVRFGHEVIGIDAAEKRVRCVADGREIDFDYDHLLLSTGARPNIPEVPGIDLPGVCVLRSLEDARHLQTLCRKGQVSRVTVVGGGYVGLAMAEALSRRGLEVSLLEAQDTILPGLERVIAQRILKVVRKAEIRVLLSAALAAVEQEVNNSRHLVVTTTEGGTYSTDLVVLATGVRPNTEIAHEAGVELGASGAIRVDPLQRTNVDGILAAGDCAEAFHRVLKHPVWLPLCPTAIKQGRVAGSVVADQSDYFRGIVGTTATEVFGTQVARTGLTMEQAREAGFDPVLAVTSAPSRAPGCRDGRSVNLAIVANRQDGRLLGAHCCGQDGAALRANTYATALHADLLAEEVAALDLAYTPTVAPVWDPVLVGASLAARKLVEPPRSSRSRTRRPQPRRH
jgi:NADPH-dependent 2,4-dienoyl-CoA reductase/sulfur reductase-like enzyme